MTFACLTRLATYSRHFLAAACIFLVSVSFSLVSLQGQPVNFPSILIAGAMASVLSTIASLSLRKTLACVAVPLMILGSMAIFGNKASPLFPVLSVISSIFAIYINRIIHTSSLCFVLIGTSCGAWIAHSQFNHTTLSELMIAFPITTTAQILNIRFFEYFEELILGSLQGMLHVLSPAVVFIAAYAGLAFLYSLAYGSMFYYLPGSIKHNPADSIPSLLVFFQWSLTVAVTAGTSELTPLSVLARVVYISQIILNLFITGIYLGYFMSYSQDRLIRGEHGDSTKCR